MLISAGQDQDVLDSHARQDIASMLHQLIQVSILATLLVLFLEEHLQNIVRSAVRKGRAGASRHLAAVLIRNTSKCCSSVKVCIYNSKYFCGVNCDVRSSPSIAAEYLRASRKLSSSCGGQRFCIAISMHAV